MQLIISGLDTPTKPTIKDHSIILGHFGKGETFYDLQDKTNSLAYMQFDKLFYNSSKEELDEYQKERLKYFHVSWARIIVWAMIYAKEIHFDLTHVYLPLKNDIVTHEELRFIFLNTSIFEKTNFYINCEPINKERVKQICFLNKPFTFGLHYFYTYSHENL